MSFPYESFMHAEFIDSKICDNLVDWFNETKDEHKDKGQIVRGNDVVVDLSTKDSIELRISRQFWGHPFGDYRDALQEVLESYIQKYPMVDTLARFGVSLNYNFQYYPPGGGYKALHFENSGTAVDAARTLVFMTYLNDVPNGGTSFPTQNITVEAEKGKTLIWPAYFTHEHVGIISDTHEKIIVTGWYEFENIRTMLHTYRGLKDIMEEQ